ncbi:hypothetical protein [Paenibacillus sp. Marseille-Q4541]|uniref:hypothetical protein n=1 Tax=Paenibacillus sp. Marseille-Q4541 TaxID=2831522 RepID=UPI001BA534A5|nr:hypothetical protein [Paenibacillus sp. Marseille-Q4541]
MTSFAKRLFLFMILIVFGILLGMQIAGSGLGFLDKQGTELPAVGEITQPVKQEEAVAVQEQHVAVQPKPQVVTPREVLVTQPGKEPAVDLFAEKTAGLLQQASQNGIRWVVSLFNGVAE